MYAIVPVGIAYLPVALAVQFTDVTAVAGIDHVHADVSSASYQSMPQARMSGGAVAVDYDQDGWPDLYFTRLVGSDLLYRNLGDGTFEDVTSSVFGTGFMTGWLTNGCGWADIDNDGDSDLYLTSLKSNRYHLWINNGSGGFTEEAVERGVSGLTDDLHFGFSVCFGDYDRDGYLDIHVNEWRPDSQNPTGAVPHTRLYRNLGAASPGHFEDVTVAAGVEMKLGAPAHELGALAFSSRFLDLDGDGWQDLMVASDGGTSRLFWNQGDGTFLDGTVASGVGSDEYGMGATVGDYDGDGDFDWFVTSILMNDVWPLGTGNRLYRNNGARRFSNVTTQAGVVDGGWGWGTSFLDFDNDRDLDLMMVNGLFRYIDETRVWENDGSGDFTRLNSATTGVTDKLPATGFLTLDFDRDGDLDTLVVNNGGIPILYRNDLVSDHGWLKLTLKGVKSNREGIGAEVRVKMSEGGNPMLRYLDGGSNFLSQCERLVHVGLGTMESPTVAEVEIRWPSGVVQTLYDVTANEVLEVTEAVDLPVMMISADPLPGNVGAQVHWEAISGGSVLIESSTDLMIWEPCAVVRDSGETGSWIDSRLPSIQRFYRAHR